MDEKLSSSELQQLHEACMAIEAEKMQEELNLLIQQDKGTGAMQALSPGGEDHDYLFDTKNSYLFVDQGNASKAFTDDNNWQLPVVQYAQSVEKETSSVDNFSNEEFSDHCIGEPSYIESGWQKCLRISVRDQNTSPEELGIQLVSRNLPESSQGDQPISQCILGKVSYTKEECLHEFLSQLQPSSCTQGCVLKEELSVGTGQYSEGKHLSHVTSLYHGAYSKVDRCQDFVSGYEFIRKKVALDKFRPTEVLFPLTIKHSNIMKICGLIQRVEVDGGNVMEILMDNGGISLVEFVKNLPESETLSQTLIWNLTKQALEGLSMLHSERIIHLDIKPENICVQKDYRGSYALTIMDFGSAMKADQQVDFVGWTPEYMAPESCRCYLEHSLKNGMFSEMNTQITGKVDIFAFGLTVLFLHEKKHVLLNLVTRGQNYHGFPIEKTNLLKIQLLLYLATEKDPVSHLISDKCCIGMRDLVSRMLSGPADERPTAEEALKCMKLTEKEMDQMMSQSSSPKLDCLAHRTRITSGKHIPIDPQSSQFTIDQGQLVEQPSCSSSVYTPKMVMVPVSQLYLPKSINSESGPIKDRMLKQKLRDKINPYMKGKINPTPMNVRNPCWASMQSPGSVPMTAKQMVAVDTCMSIKESGVMETGYNITQQQFLEELGVSLIPQFQDTKPVQPSSHTDQGSNMVALCGNIPNFDAMVNI